MLLQKHIVHKPWGREKLPEPFDNIDDGKIGEIWFQPPGDGASELMVKYLFTSERLSIQVHPDDTQARARGHKSGKTECWYILDAAADAVLGIGTLRPLSADQLQAAASSGEIEQLMDWKPVKTHDFFYIEPGTIHAIGPGITLIEIQQNIDLTYRLYDYGRPRTLHLDDATQVSLARPYDMQNHKFITANNSQILADGPAFRVYQIVGDDLSSIGPVSDKEIQIVPLRHSAYVHKQEIAAGECGLCRESSAIELDKQGLSLIAVAH